LKLISIQCVIVSCIPIVLIRMVWISDPWSNRTDVLMGGIMGREGLIPRRFGWHERDPLNPPMY
jgi:hypothetical protein